VGRLALAISVIAGALLLANREPPGGSSPRPGVRAGNPTFVFPQSGFGGYQWSGDVRQISASWRVPRISPSSWSGAAATWIGAQDDATSRFIQVGVFELSRSLMSPVYRAFWSDTRLKFRPQWIGYVAARDVVASSLVHSRRGWTVGISDGAAHLAFSRTVAYGAGGSFTTGEWIQEDPAPSEVSAKDVPYPDIANVRFSQVEVNRRVPRLRLANGLTLSARGGTIRVPTSVVRDSFTFYFPAGAAAQYLRDAGRFDVAFARIDAELVSWGSLSTTLRRQDALAFERSLASDATVVARQTWPARARRDVALLLTQLRRAALDLHAWSLGGLHLKGPGYARVHADGIAFGGTAIAVRATLGLPPP